MPRRGEYIFKRKDGRWEARYVKGVNKDNKKVYGSVYAKTYTEVKEKRKDKCLELENNSSNENDKIQNNDFSYYMVRWLDMYKITFKESTYAKYYNTIQKYLIPQLGNESVYAISTKKIEKLSYKLLNNANPCGKSLSVKTVRDILSILNRIIVFVQSEYQLCLDVKVIYPKLQRKEPRILTQEEFDSLNQFLLKDMDSCKFGILIAMSTGIRIGELCALKWENINLEEKYIHIQKTMQRIKDCSDNPIAKTKIIEGEPKSCSSNRKIPISDDLVSLCKKFHKAGNCYVLTGLKDKFIEPRSLERKFAKYVKQAGISPINFHILRHTFATMCIESGFELKCLSEILGHSGPQITLDRYIHSSFKTKRNYMNEFIASHICCQ